MPEKKKRRSLEDWCKDNNNLQLLSEWDYEKNKPITPSMVAPHSNKYFYWIGLCKHTWKDSVNHRTGRYSQCPQCDRESKTSFQEQAIFYYLKQIFPSVINGDRTILGNKLEFL